MGLMKCQFGSESRGSVKPYFNLLNQLLIKKKLEMRKMRMRSVIVIPSREEVF